MSYNLAQQPLLIGDEPIDSDIYKHKSKCCKCIDYCVIPLDILIYPLTGCMKASCWSKKRYYQYDLAIQLMGIYQTLIGALWASSFLSILNEFDNPEATETLFIALYCAVTYAACNIIVILMQRKRFFSEKISFFIGILAEIVAFGVKALALKIMGLYFSNTFHASILYFGVCLAVSITFIYGFRWMRKQFCFALKELNKQTAEIRQKLADDMSNKIQNSINRIRVKSSDNTNGLEIYESDVMNALLFGDHKQQSEAAEEKEEQESFHDLVREIDTDIFTIAMGSIFVEVIIYSLTQEYVQLNDQEEYDNTDEEALEQHVMDIIQTVAVLTAIVIAIFSIFVNIISYIQMKRDRVLYKIFKSLEHRSNSSNSLGQIKLGELEINENCCIAGCIRFSYQSYKLSEHIVTFIIGFLGWAFGWTLVSGLYWTDKVYDRLYYSCVLTALGILMYFIRSIRMKRKFEKWKRKAKFTMEVRNAELVESENDNVFVHEVSETEYDMFEMKAKHHHALYRISNLNFFFRKAYGLMVALPWELTYEYVAEDMVDGVTHAILLRFSVAFAATIILSYCGVQFVNIVSDAHHHSTAHATAQLLKGNYMKLKRFV